MTLKLKASDLSWRATWEGEKRFTLEIFDYGPGVSSYDAGKTNVVERSLATALFVYNEKRKVFEKTGK